MAHYKVEDTSLTTVADAIRERTGRNIKGGVSDPLAFPDWMESAIRDIPDYLDLYLNGTLKEYYHPTLTRVKEWGFAYNQQMVKIELPLVTESGYYGFHNTQALAEVIMPKLEIISQCGFARSGFKKLDCPLLRKIQDQGLNYTPIETLVLRRTDMMCELVSTLGIGNSPLSKGTGYVYCPRKFLSDTDAFSDYRRATNWSTLAARQFRILEDYTVDGTTTGALDESKI